MNNSINKYIDTNLKRKRDDNDNVYNQVNHNQE